MDILVIPSYLNLNTPKSYQINPLWSFPKFYKDFIRLNIICLAVGDDSHYEIRREAAEKDVEVVNEIMETIEEYLENVDG